MFVGLDILDPVVASVSFLAGAVATYACRGLVNRIVNKAKGVVLADVKAVHADLTAVSAKAEGEVRNVIDSVRIKLAKYL